MIAKVKSCGLFGLDGYIVDVEVDISMGLPAFDIVGLPDAAVRESKERVRAALKNSSFEVPPRRITVNLAPADQKKEGPAYDLPITIGILSATGQLKADSGDCLFLGELSLDGALRPVQGVLPMALSAAGAGITRIILPEENAREAALVTGLSVFGARDLWQIVRHLRGEELLAPCAVDREALFQLSEAPLLDFADVKGQHSVKRAVEVAVAGGHNLIMIGSPGSGKSMLAKRIPGILPDLTMDEALEVTKIHSVAGVLTKGTALVTARPFRSPHHSVSPAGLSGGGAHPRPGELSLAHNGVLFLDELPEFRRDALEVMRQPLEEGSVTISRVNATVSYPCRAMLVASMNPCKCGYYGDTVRQCICTPPQISKYVGKISGPLLDRIDLHIEVASVKYEDLEHGGPPEESSAEIKRRVDAARRRQLERYSKEGIFCNAQLGPAGIRRHCALGGEQKALLRAAFQNLGLSARAHDRILKVARTIADLDGSGAIGSHHIAEAIGYRSLDRKYWQ